MTSNSFKYTCNYITIDLQLLEINVKKEGTMYYAIQCFTEGYD